MFEAAHDGFLGLRRAYGASSDALWWQQATSIGGAAVRVAGLCSTWAADAEGAVLGAWQARDTLREQHGEDLVIAAVHHPWDHLVPWDQTESGHAVRAGAAVVLHRARAEGSSFRTVGQTAEIGVGADTFLLLEIDPYEGLATVLPRVWREGRWYPAADTVRATTTLQFRPSPNPRPAVEAAPSPPPMRATVDPLAAYRSQLRAEFDRLPDVFRRGGERALSDVFVEVRLSGSLEADPEAMYPRTKAWRGRTPQGAGEMEGRLHLAEVATIEAHRRWALLGDPGAGKTTLLHRLGLDLLDDPSGPVPIYLRVATFQAGDGLAQLLPRENQPAADPLLAAVRAGRAVLLLDGLDEHQNPHVARRVVTTVAAEAGACPVFVSSRPIGFETPAGGFAELRLCPLGREAQEELLQHWVEDVRTVRDTLDAMGRRPRLRKIIENPLLLTLAGIVLLEGGTVPRRRSLLYAEAVKHLMVGAHRTGEGVRSLPAQHLAEEALGRLALTLHGNEQPLTPVGDMIWALESSGDLAARLRPTWRGLAEFLRDVAETTGLLVPDPNLAMAERYGFPHRSLREFLAAKALEADIGRHGIGEVPLEALQGAVQTAEAVPVPDTPGALGVALKRAAETPATWAEVLALTCGLVGEGTADQLVRRVAATGSPELVARVVSEAEAIAHDTVAAALGVQQGQEEWRARSDVLQQLPELVGDAGVVTRLLDRFAEGTTHGADLWWVQHLLRQIAEGSLASLVVSEEVQREAVGLAAGMWERHRPEARAKALAALEPWWRPIPAGDFLMGSPSGEEGRINNDEGPQHRVTMARGFHMLGVPVTNRMYEWFDPNHQAERPEGAEDHPVANVTWYEAVAFAAWVGARLPVEVEWEYGCRAGTTTRYWSGDAATDLARVGWVDSNSGEQPHPVAEKPPNAWGLYDVHGNVSEWCHDEGVSYRDAARSHDAAAVAAWPDGATGAGRVIRGGSFVDGPRWARSAQRFRFVLRGRSSGMGFRLVRASAPQS